MTISTHLRPITYAAHSRVGRQCKGNLSARASVEGACTRAATRRPCVAESVPYALCAQRDARNGIFAFRVRFSLRGLFSPILNSVRWV